jgi:hypothetical protein
MTGATLGGTTGATLGTTSGATLGTVATEPYLIDGQQAGELTSEAATYRTLSLSFRVTTARLEQVFRPLKPDEGKVDTVTTDTGGYRAVDRADGANTFSLDPPPRRQPLRRTGDVHVASYEEDLVSQAVGEFQVDIEFVRARERTDTASISQTAASDEWGLTTVNGTIATGRVDADLLGTGRDGVERFEILARLTFEQALAWETAVSQQAGVRVKSIPDAPNVVRDDTSSDTNTITVDAPDSQSVVSDGDYVVLEWETERLNDAFQEYTIEVAAV